jgi:hypothetical protein
MASDVKGDAHGKKRSYASNAILYAVFAVGAVVAINLISTRVFGRLDLTENKTYTLSKPSKDLVKSLPDFLTVKAFISPDLPDKVTPLGRYVPRLWSTSTGRPRTASSAGKPSTWPPTRTRRRTRSSRKRPTAARCRRSRSRRCRARSSRWAPTTWGLCLEYGSQVESIAR